jgi:hypothetical protein
MRSCDQLVYRFQASTSPSCQPLAPIDTPDLVFAPMAGTTGELAVAGSPTVFVKLQSGIPGPVLLQDSSGLAPFNARSFQLTTEDGMVYVVSQGGGLESMTDRQHESSSRVGRVLINALPVIHVTNGGETM